MLGMGSSTFTASPPYSQSGTPTSGAPKSSDPPEKAAAGVVGQADQQHQDGDCHLGQRGDVRDRDRFSSAKTSQPRSFGEREGSVRPPPCLLYTSPSPRDGLL